MAVSSLGVVGTSSSATGSSIVIPITVDVPRSDPSGGATVVIVSLIYSGTVAPTLPPGLHDDAPSDPFYNVGIFSSGKNFYTAPVMGGGRNNHDLWAGLILNPLVAGRDSIIYSLSGAPSFVRAFAVAYLHCNCDISGHQSPSFPNFTFPGHAASPFGKFAWPDGVTTSVQVTATNSPFGDNTGSVSYESGAAPWVLTLGEYGVATWAVTQQVDDAVTFGSGNPLIGWQAFNGPWTNIHDDGGAALDSGNVGYVYGENATIGDPESDSSIDDWGGLWSLSGGGPLYNPGGTLLALRSGPGPAQPAPLPDMGGLRVWARF